MFERLLIAFTLTLALSHMGRERAPLLPLGEGLGMRVNTRHPNPF
jgi:hypothetical protein